MWNDGSYVQMMLNAAHEHVWCRATRIGRKLRTNDSGSCAQVMSYVEQIQPIKTQICDKEQFIIDFNIFTSHYKKRFFF